MCCNYFDVALVLFTSKLFTTERVVLNERRGRVLVLRNGEAPVLLMEGGGGGKRVTAPDP